MSFDAIELLLDVFGLHGFVVDVTLLVILVLFEVWREAVVGFEVADWRCMRLVKGLIA
jgi:hypothetical protein